MASPTPAAPLEPPIEHDAGGKRLPIPKGVTAHAVFDGPGNCYRYWLEWIWARGLPTLAAGLMNPSCAGPDCADRTLLWLFRWACANKFGRLIVVNADAYRCADQLRLAEIGDPRGPRNPDYWDWAADQGDLVCLGYGQPKIRALSQHGPHMARAMHDAGAKLHIWALGANNTPKHPLYLSGGVCASPWPRP